MGDVVSATTFMQDICAAYPQADIDFNTLPAWHNLFAGDPRFKRVFAIDTRASSGRLRGMLRWMSIVWKGRYDLIFDLQSTDRTRIMLGLLRLVSPWTQAIIGHNPGYPYTHAPQRPQIPYPGWHSELALREADVPHVAKHGHLHVPEQDRKIVEGLMHETGLENGQYVVLLPGSQKAGWIKRWGVQRYTELAKTLIQAGVKKVAIIGGPDEIEDCAVIASQAGEGVVNLNGRTSIRQIVPLAEQAACIVGNDTGAAHVVATTGRPLLVICGPTDPRRVRPIGQHVRAVQWAGECINCYRKTCNYKLELACMEAVTVRFVAGWVLNKCGISLETWDYTESIKLY